MHICLVYDLLSPYTIGGAERWYRNLAELSSRWASRHVPDAASLARGRDRGGSGSRGCDRRAEDSSSTPQADDGGSGPALRFGLGVLRHLTRVGGRYDVVHTASFPYFSLLAAALARRRHRFRLVVDWYEVWSDEYWRDYLGPVAGRVGLAVQRRCIRVPHRAFCFSRLHRTTSSGGGLRGVVTVLEGMYAGPPGSPPEAAEPVVVFAGRHIPEKQAPALVPAIARARERVPELRGEIFGNGPARPEVLRLIAEHGLVGAVQAPGFVAEDRLRTALRRALCLALPSRREGYGLVVVEAAALGVPTVVVRGPDNAATELVEDGENGGIGLPSSPPSSPQQSSAYIGQGRRSENPLRPGLRETQNGSPSSTRSRSCWRPMSRKRRLRSARGDEHEEGGVARVEPGKQAGGTRRERVVTGSFDPLHLETVVFRKVLASARPVKIRR